MFAGRELAQFWNSALLTILLTFTDAIDAQTLAQFACLHQPSLKRLTVHKPLASSYGVPDENLFLMRDSPFMIAPPTRWRVKPIVAMKAGRGSLQSK